MDDATVRSQHEVCERHGVPHCQSPSDLKLGVALNLRDKESPLNGLRHPPEGDTTGWYLWRGSDISGDPDFFKPLHVEHLSDWCPEVQKYLGLPPGWRFLIAGEYEDVWYDESLLTPK